MTTPVRVLLFWLLPGLHTLWDQLQTDIGAEADESERRTNGTHAGPH